MFNLLKINILSPKLLPLVSGISLATISLALTAGSASAGTLTFNFNNTPFNGGTPLSPAPYATAVFTDVNATTVSLTITSSLSANRSNEFFSDATFNFNPDKSLTNLNISQVGGANTSGSTNPLISSIGKTTQDAQSLSGSGNEPFDIKFNWGNSGSNGGAGRFNLTDTNNFTITLASGLSVEDFSYANANGKYAGVHIQGISGSNGASGAAASSIPTAVPEPLTVLGAVTAAGFGASFKRRLAKANKKAE